MGHRHEQSQAPDAALEVGTGDGAADDAIGTAATLELGFSGVTTEVVSIWFRSPAVTTDWELDGAGACC